MASPPPRPLLLEPATEADIPTLASILVAALFPEPTMAFFFPSWPSTSGMTRFYTARLTAKFHDPDSELLKLTYGDEIVGLGSITLKEGETKEYSKAAPMKGFDPEFAWASGECFRKTEGLMLGRKSYCILPGPTSCSSF
ncbi:uncharacterized protein LY89DRAFT_352727 [Mollisia scopiformis]|uniref:N-acetyltransferase domain-containing protein n=1 Tax=Mollisia scopiformis TaxID=149040 RepID=A0A132B5V3_MOLSC|nr:uncharacterized protein LY89DRAFT_352727 [Mollisia scopiformis]KUJ07782.1 hypothetical protein LY89DRAFT_352727 [Mollisia scopiformis]